MGDLWIVAVVVAVLGLGWLASRSLPELPGREIAASAMQSGVETVLTFAAPGSKGAVWLHLDAERAEGAAAVAGVQVALLMRAGDRTVVEHPGFSIDDRSRADSPFAEGIVKVNTYVGGAFRYRTTAQLVPFAEPPGTPIEIVARVTPNAGTTLHALRLLAACPTRRRDRAERPDASVS